MSRPSPLATHHHCSAPRGTRGVSRAYSPYGYLPQQEAPLTGFTGQPRDRVHGFYHLGNGHRVYQPTLMRFLSADHLSPFGNGGINAYAYCGGDPVNRIDASGRSWMSVLTNVFFGASGTAGAINMVLARARVRIDNVALPTGVTDPQRSRLHSSLLAFGTTSDTYAYATSTAIRPSAIRALYDAGAAAASAFGLGIADAGRSMLGFAGYAALPLNIRHEWQRAGVRNMPRGQLVRDAALDAFGLSYAWQGLRYVAGAVGTAAEAVGTAAGEVGTAVGDAGRAASRLVGQVVARIRGNRQRTDDIEMGRR